MPYFNAGAYIGNSRARTKKQLREALAADPTSVYFDGTSMFSHVTGYAAENVPDGTIISVVGPDPFTKRSWYASVQRLPDGKFKVA